MCEYRFRIARAADRADIIQFMNTHWELRHPIVNLPEFFAYYYEAPDGRLNFALCEQDKKLCAIAGFIPASISIKPDVWVSLWVADKAARGAGLELMAALPGLVSCRTLSCNNIRPETRIFYEFLGYTTGRMGHFYRLGRCDTFTLARVGDKTRLPVSGRAGLVAYHTSADLDASGFIPPEGANPYKDLWYIRRRYYQYPHQAYRVYGVLLPGERAPRALLCARIAVAGSARVVRIADFIGDTALLPECGPAIDALLRAERAEYADLYCAGLPAQLLADAGFCERREGDVHNILPNYLEPPVYENTDYYYFTSRPEQYVLFKADGDQDRPNLPVPPQE